MLPLTIVSVDIELVVMCWSVDTGEFIGDELVIGMVADDIGIEASEDVEGMPTCDAAVAALLSAGDVVDVLPQADTTTVAASAGAPNRVDDRMGEVAPVGGCDLDGRTRVNRSSQQIATHNIVSPGGRAGRKPRNGRSNIGGHTVRVRRTRRTANIAMQATPTKLAKASNWHAATRFIPSDPL